MPRSWTARTGPEIVQSLEDLAARAASRHVRAGRKRSTPAALAEVGRHRRRAASSDCCRMRALIITTETAMNNLRSNRPSRRMLLKDLDTLHYVGRTPFTSDALIDVIDRRRVWPAWRSRSASAAADAEALGLVAASKLLGVPGPISEGPLARASTMTSHFGVEGRQARGPGSRTTLARSTLDVLQPARPSASSPSTTLARRRHAQRTINPCPVYADQGQSLVDLRHSTSRGEQNLPVDRMQTASRPGSVERPAATATASSRAGTNGQRSSTFAPRTWVTDPLRAAVEDPAGRHRTEPGDPRRDSRAVSSNGCSWPRQPWIVFVERPGGLRRAFWSGDGAGDRNEEDDQPAPALWPPTPRSWIRPGEGVITEAPAQRHAEAKGSVIPPRGSSRSPWWPGWRRPRHRPSCFLFYIPSSSMETTLDVGDQVLVAGSDPRHESRRPDRFERGERGPDPRPHRRRSPVRETIKRQNGQILIDVGLEELPQRHHHRRLRPISPWSQCW